MRILPLILALTLLAPPAFAQDTAKQMLDLARQLRSQAAQMKDTLPPEDVADLIRQAEEIEQGVRDGGYSAPVAEQPVSLADRIAGEHEGRLDWLDGEAACVGYGWENHRTFVSNYGDAKRDQLCRTAFGHFERYFLLTRDGGDRAQALTALDAYDKAAQAAVAYYADR